MPPTSSPSLLMSRRHPTAVGSDDDVSSDDNGSDDSSASSNDAIAGADAFARRFRPRAPGRPGSMGSSNARMQPSLRGEAVLADDVPRIPAFARPSVTLSRASRTLDLMRQRATMLQLVLELSRQELELNLQRMRMEEELELAVALSRSLADDDGNAPSKPKGMSSVDIEEQAPKQLYSSAIVVDRQAHGRASCLPGGA